MQNKQAPANNLRRYRESAALTQQDLADKVCAETPHTISGQTIANIEARRVNPRPGTKRMLANVLGVAPSELFPLAEEDLPARVLATAS